MHNQIQNDDSSRPDMARMIIEILSRAEKPYLTVNQIKKRLPSECFRRLGVRRQKLRNVQLLDMLKADIGDRLRVYRGPRAVYIGINHTLEDIIFAKIKQHPGVSSRALAGRVPMLKRECIDGVNRLVEGGRLRCILDQAHRATLWPVVPDDPAPDRKALFKEAYDRIGKGRGFVRIHRIRESLGWPDGIFDSMLRSLMAEYVVELHGGDPSGLSEHEIRNSFVDENGMLYITLSWWGEDHEK
jgi:hypothetical protein